MEYKRYSGAGNTFLIVNNTDESVKNHKDIVLQLIGEKGNEKYDGVIFVESSDIADFRMNYYNKDGTGNTLCGNGLRCTAKYIRDNGLLSNDNMTIEAVSKIFGCKILEDSQISVTFPPPKIMRLNFTLKVNFSEWWYQLRVHYVDIGSPHIVVFIRDIKNPIINHLYEVNVNNWGRNIRMHKDLMPEGANVNFVELKSYERSELEIRSYERGVEGETLACGTGILSAALVGYSFYDIIPPLKFLTKSDEILTVDFEKEGEEFKNLTLTGKATEIIKRNQE